MRGAPAVDELGGRGSQARARNRVLLTDAAAGTWLSRGRTARLHPPRTRRTQGRRRGRLASPHGGVVTLWFGS